METRNYARNIQTKEIIFFDMGSLPPAHVRAQPMSWAMWKRPVDDRFYRLVGESLDEYCLTFNHRPKQCKYCRASVSSLLARS